MDNPRPEKVAVVDEVRTRLGSADAALLTEYRGLNVSATATLRRNLQDAGGDYKIYKNTLVRFAARDLGLDIEDLLTGPTAIAFVHGDPVLVAKALRDFARTNPALVVKGGLLGTKAMDADAVRALADVEPREVLLARLAGAFAAPMQQFAGLLQALPRNFAYGLKALIDQGGTGIETEPPPAEASPAETATGDMPYADLPAADLVSADPVSTDIPPSDSVDESAPQSPELPAADAAGTTQES
jgi:large subunit ribosomal protein L10